MRLWRIRLFNLRALLYLAPIAREPRSSFRHASYQNALLYKRAKTSTLNTAYQ
jgi:hypothetical protein